MGVQRIIRNKSKLFTTICNDIMRENGISLKAKGLYALVMSLPDSWDFSISGICAISKEQTSAIYSAIKELIDAGYCVRHQENANGRFSSYNYIFFENKAEVPHLDFPHTDFPHTENRIQYTKDNNKITKDNNENKKSSKEDEKVDEFTTYMRQHYPYIMKMDKPLTQQQAKKLKEEYGEDAVLEVFEAMDNYKPLLKNYRDAYRVAQKWCQRRGVPQKQKEG